MLSGQFPFSENEAKRDDLKFIFKQILAKEINFEIDAFKDVSTPTMNLLKLMLCKIPSKRIPLKKVLTCPLISDIQIVKPMFITKEDKTNFMFNLRE